MEIASSVCVLVMLVLASIMIILNTYALAKKTRITGNSPLATFTLEIDRFIAITTSGFVILYCIAYFIRSTS